MKWKTALLAFVACAGLCLAGYAGLDRSADAMPNTMNGISTGGALGGAYADTLVLASAIGVIHHADQVGAAFALEVVPDAGRPTVGQSAPGLNTVTDAEHPDAAVNPGGWLSWWVRGVSAGKFTFWIGCSSALLGALVITRRLWPRPFETDIGGTMFAFGAAALGALATTAASNAAVGVATFAAAFKVGIGATGGYSVLWKKVGRPLLEHFGIVDPPKPAKLA